MKKLSISLLFCVLLFQTSYLMGQDKVKEKQEPKKEQTSKKKDNACKDDSCKKTKHSRLKK